MCFMEVYSMFKSFAKSITKYLFCSVKYTSVWYLQLCDAFAKHGTWFRDQQVTGTDCLSDLN